MSFGSYGFSFFPFFFFPARGRGKKRKQGHSFLELFFFLSSFLWRAWPLPPPPRQAQWTPVSREVGSVMTYSGALNFPITFGESQIGSALRDRGSVKRNRTYTSAFKEFQQIQIQKNKWDSLYTLFLIDQQWLPAAVWENNEQWRRLPA